MVVGIFTIFCLLILGAEVTTGITYKEYMELDEDNKAKLIKKYVVREGDWWKVKRPYYIVGSDVSAEVCLRFAIFLDDFYKKFVYLFKGKFKKNDIPLVLIIDSGRFSDFLKREYDYIAPSNIGGVYIANKEVLAVPYSPGRDSIILRAIQHEGTHQLLHYYTGRLIIPLWFGEGAATNLEEWDIYKTAAENLSKSPKESYYFRILLQAAKERRLIRFDELISMGPEDWIEEGSLDPIKYAQSWFTVNFLFRTKDGRTFFNKCLIALRKEDGGIKEILDEKTKKALVSALDRHLRKLLEISSSKRIYRR